MYDEDHEYGGPFLSLYGKSSLATKTDESFYKDYLESLACLQGLGSSNPLNSDEDAPFLNNLDTFPLKNLT